ncbi:MAG: hypothetical protein ACLFR0_00290 [Alphaproteobacteria bacterium]
MGFLAKHIGHKQILKPLETRRSKRENVVELLNFANSNVPFYKGRYNDFLKQQDGWDEQKFWEKFAKTPITTKADLKAGNTAFCARQFSSKRELIQNGAPPDLKRAISSLFIKKDFKVSISTGGTSGIPTYRWLDHQDANVMAQSFLESFHLNGWRRGESFVLYYPLRSYFTGAYAEFNGWLHRLFGFTVVPFETITKESVLELLHILKTRKVSLLVIFPCVLQRVAEIMHTHHIEPFRGLKYINVSGEFFFDCSKTFIQDMFPGSRIEMTYGAVELGEIAHQSGTSSFDYKVFDNFAHVEESEDDALYITSLRQKSFPMIRYKMEDKASVQTDENGTQYLHNLEGKNTDYLIGADGQKYYASFFNHMVNLLNGECMSAIIHFMMRHEGQAASLNFVLQDESPRYKAYIEAEATRIFRETFPQFEHISVNFMDHFNHDYTRKFKIIGEGDGLAEVVGGYYKRKAS